MNRFLPLFLAAVLGLGAPSETRAQSPSLAPRVVYSDTDTAVTADTNFTSDPIVPTVALPFASTFRATVVISTSAASIMLEVDPDATGAASALTAFNLKPDGLDLGLLRQEVVFWEGLPGQSYKLQMSESTTIVSIVVVELRGGISTAGRGGGGGAGDLTAIEETGNGIAVASGTGPIPSLSVQAHLEDVASITSADADQFLGFTGTTALVNRTAAQVLTSLGIGAGADLTAITETGDALTVTNGTGPAPDLAAHANVEGLADAGTMVAGDLFYATSSTAISRLAKGTAAQQLRMNAGATALEYFTPSAGSALFSVWLDPRDGAPPAGANATNSSFIATRGGFYCQEFPASDEGASGDPGDADSACEWIFRLPSTFSSSNNVQVDLLWMAEGATTGDVIWLIEVEAFGATELDLDASSFDTAQSVTTTTSGTDGNTVLTSKQHTNAEFDGAAGGDYVRIRVSRDSTDAADTMAVRAQLLGVAIEEEAP